MNYELSIDLIKRLFVFGAIAFLLAVAVRPAFSRVPVLNFPRPEPTQLARPIDPDLYAFLEIMKQFGREYGSKLTTPERELLRDSEAFADRRNFEIRSMTAAAFLEPPTRDEILQFFEQRLEAGDFEFQEIGRYNRQPVYRISKGEFQVFLLLPPTTRRMADGSPGTAVILAAPTLTLDVPPVAP